MARTHDTELIVVNAETRRPVLDLDPLTVRTAGTYWVRSDQPGLAAFVGAARQFAAEAGIPVDIVWSGDPERSFESACDHHEFAPLIDMLPVGDTLTNPSRCPNCDGGHNPSPVWFNGWDGR